MVNLRENQVIKYQGKYYKIERFNDTDKYLTCKNLINQKSIRIKYSDVIEILK